MSRYFDLRRPLLLAHRGSCAHAPENTVAAFRLAVEQGADGIELDAKLTADGEIVVIHDQTVDRTTGAHGEVRKMTLAELRRLDAGSSFSPAFAGERIPTLEEVFTAVGGKCLIDIEITNYAAILDGLPDRIVALVRRYGLENSIFFTSFVPFNIARVRRLLPQVPAGLLAWTGLPGRLAYGPLGRLFAPRLVLPHYTEINAEFIHKQHSFGREVITWTLNDTEAAGRLLANGLDGIITDDPLTMRAVFD